jgi:hypothetical protein
MERVTYLLDQADDSDNRIRVYIYEDTGDYWFRAHIDSGGVTLLNVEVVLPVPALGTWYHWALTRSGNDNRLYFNGAQVGDTVVASYTFPTLSANLNLGVSFYVDFYFDGRMDDFTWDKGTALWTGATYTPPARSSTPAPPPITDPPEWMLYDSDFKTALHILKGYNAKLYMRLNDAGSGEITIPLSDAAASDIVIGHFVALNYRGAFRGGFFVENIARTYVNRQEYSGRAIKASGRGMLSLIDDAIVWDWMTPGTENIRYFGTKDITSEYTGYGAPVSKGWMMHYLLDEAVNHQVNPSGGHLHRYVWHIDGTEGGDIILAWDFDHDTDSSSNSWTDAEDMEFRVGFGLFDVLKQIAALEYDFTMDWSATTGVFTLHAYKSRIGTDKSDTIYFRLGNHCLEVTNDQSGAEVRNAILVEFSHPSVPYTNVTDGTSITTYRRRESLLTSSNAYTEDTAIHFGEAELATTKDPINDILIQVSDSVAPMAFVDYAIGDTVSHDDMTGTMQEYRIIGMQLAWNGDEQYAKVTLEME